jgi:hypothetical protein
MESVGKEELLEINKIVISVRRLLQEAEGLITSGQDRATGMRMMNECKTILKYAIDLEKKLAFTYKIKSEAEKLLKSTEAVLTRL